MPDKNTASRKELATATRAEYGVLLPCSQSEFGAFISGLLGKPQTIQRTFFGAFDLGKDHLVDTYHLLDQRIHQQNEATLIQFTVKIVYDDNSSVLLNSLEDFLHYKEIRPLVSVAAHLSWTYLIRFQDKKVPERQQIEITFRAMSNVPGSFSPEDELILPFRYASRSEGRIEFRATHTARSWGVDIESLVADHVKILMKTESKWKTFLNRNSGRLGVAFGSLFLVSCIWGAYFTMTVFVQSQVEKARMLDASGAVANLEEQVTFLLESVAAGAWPRFTLSVVGFISVALIVSVFLGGWVGASADNRPASFLLLTSKAEEHRNAMLLRRRKGWWNFAASLLTGVVTGLAANLLFAYLFG